MRITILFCWFCHGVYAMLYYKPISTYTILRYYISISFCHCIEIHISNPQDKIVFLCINKCFYFLNGVPNIGKHTYKKMILIIYFMFILCYLAIEMAPRHVKKAPHIFEISLKSVIRKSMKMKVSKWNCGPQKSLLPLHYILSRQSSSECFG